jgi:hypothetical protein
VIDPVALKFEKTPGEIWLERLKAGFYSFLLIVGHSLLFFTAVSRLARALAIVVSVGQCYLVWQGISKITTGERFAVRFTASPGQLRELFDVTFSCVFLVNAALFLYVILNWPVTR